MTPAQWRRVRALLEEALVHPPGERAAFLGREEVDPDDRLEVELLLRAYDEGGAAILDAPLGSVAGHLLTEPGDLRPGDRVGTYRIVRCLGQGGMGVVYLARDERLDRDVALKLLHGNGPHDTRQRERLRQEARAAAAVSHPGIAQVHALEADRRGGWFVVSEYVDGHSLRGELRNGPLEVSVAIDTAIQVAEAVAAAHARGIVHRDLKPENIMRGADGRVKVLDFGIARLLEAPDTEDTRERLTVAGTVMGTPAYMAPEQLRGADAGVGADIFALGVVLHEMLAGRHPFAGADHATTAMVVGILERPPEPLPAAVAEGWPALPAIVDRCLRKDPGERFGSMSALARALVAARGVGTAAEAPAQRSDPSPAIAAAAASDDAGSRLWWWRFHQLAVVATYALVLYPAWTLRALPTARLAHALIVLALSVVATLSATLRLHWLFTARVLPGQLARARRRAGPWIRAADWAMSGLLVVAAAACLRADRLGLALILAAMAAGALAAALLIEPATTEGAFGPEAA